MGIILSFAFLAVVVFFIGVLFNLKRQERLDRTFDMAHRRRASTMNQVSPSH